MPPQVRDAGIIVNGFTGLQHALERVEGSKGNYGAAYDLQHRLKLIGEKVAKAAPGFVPHKTGRHGDPSQPRLEDSVRVSVTKRSASVYSTASYGGLQQYGGGPKAGWQARGPHVQRKDASKWMSRAVASQREEVQRETEQLVDDVVREFERNI